MARDKKQTTARPCLDTQKNRRHRAKTLTEFAPAIKPTRRLRAIRALCRTAASAARDAWITILQP
ncbi:MAG: hypothetical protein K2Y27_32175 [Xanthobacteraceae bacterium]|nr:hypothetical protein [Xanthobacteraceae bacterium]